MVEAFGSKKAITMTGVFLALWVLSPVENRIRVQPKKDWEVLDHDHISNIRTR